MHLKYRADGPTAEVDTDETGRSAPAPERPAQFDNPPSFLEKPEPAEAPSVPTRPQQPPDLSPGDRQDAASDHRRGDVPRQADPPRRQVRARPHDQGEPAPRREDRDGLQGFRPAAARPDQRGQHRPRQGRRALRSAQGRQALDLCRLVDQAVDQAGPGQPVEDDPPARPPGRQDLPDEEDGDAALRAPGARADRRGARDGAADPDLEGRAPEVRERAAGLARRAGRRGRRLGHLRRDRGRRERRPAPSTTFATRT